MKKNVWYALCMFLFVTLACRPVIAIGGEEFLVLFVLFVFLLGPPLYRFIRRVESILKREKKDK